MVHARNVKPPVAGAKLVSIDESSVKDIPGFVKVVSKGNYVAVVCEREEQEINQEEAAERCGLHRTYYSGVERGIRNVSLVNVEKIARGLRTSLPELFRRV
jgi:DNA-binding XRE family transcriptional regulator